MINCPSFAPELPIYCPNPARDGQWTHDPLLPFSPHSRRSLPLALHGIAARLSKTLQRREYCAGPEFSDRVADRRR
jgi:hypothetical protein